MVTSNHGKRKGGRLAAAEHGAFGKCGIRSPRNSLHLRYPLLEFPYFFVEQVDALRQPTIRPLMIDQWERQENCAVRRTRMRQVLLQFPVMAITARNHDIGK